MKLLKKTLSQIASQTGTPALMTHVVLGYPSYKESLDIVRAMADSGASIIELQIPFSDPMADGPTIMRANEAALAEGITPKDCLKAMEALSSKVSVPLLFMSYCNVVLSYDSRNTENGLSAFSKAAAEAGAQGLIVPDIPVEENSDGYWTETIKAGLLPVPLVSPVSGPRRMKMIAQRSPKDGFVYCVSTTATTGAKAKLPSGLKNYLRTVRKYFSSPLALGFGISTPSHVRALSGHADIAIVGSAVIDLISNTEKKKRIARVSRFVSSLVK